MRITANCLFSGATLREHCELLSGRWGMRIFVILFSLLLFACSSSSIPGDLEVWPGKKGDDLIRNIGPPLSKSKLHNGNVIWLYQFRKSPSWALFFLPGFAKGYQEGQRTTALQEAGGNRWCNVYYELDQNDIIISAREVSMRC